MISWPYNKLKLLFVKELTFEQLIVKSVQITGVGKLALYTRNGKVQPQVSKIKLILKPNNSYLTLSGLIIEMLKIKLKALPEP
jgi:hypothetical protein